MVVKQAMQPEIKRSKSVDPGEVNQLRAAVGWEFSDETSEKRMERHYAYYSARDDESNLIGYLSVLSDGIGDAFLIDLMVHPEHQKTGLGMRLVRKAIGDMKQAGIQCIQVTFNDELESFYKKCGFHIFKAGIIDFHHMDWE